MHRPIPWRAKAVAAGVCLTASLVGCFLITGSTDGYFLATGDAGICQVDTSTPGLTCGCSSAADCNDGGGYCCLGSSGTSAASACQPTPCAKSTIQLCTQNAECPGDASCSLQSCSLGGFPLSIETCGQLPSTCLP